MRREWDSAQPRPGRVEHGIRQRRSHRRAGRFTGAKRRLGRPVDQRDVELGNVGEAQDRIAAPIETRHPRAIELDLFHQRPAEGLQDAALNLRSRAVGVDDLPAVKRARHPLDFDAAARALDRNLHAHRHESLAVLVVDIGHAATPRDRGFCISTRRRPGLPFHHRRHAPDQLDAARIVEAAQAKLDRVDARRRRQLIGEALDRKTIGRLAGRAQRRRPQRRFFQPMHDDLDVVCRIGRIAVLRDQAGVKSNDIVEARCLRPE